MKTEHSAATQAHKAARGAHSAKSPGGVNASPGLDSGGGGGFLSLMASFEAAMDGVEKVVSIPPTVETPAQPLLQPQLPEQPQLQLQAQPPVLLSAAANQDASSLAQQFHGYALPALTAGVQAAEATETAPHSVNVAIKKDRNDGPGGFSTNSLGSVQPMAFELVADPATAVDVSMLLSQFDQRSGGAEARERSVKLVQRALSDGVAAGAATVSQLAYADSAGVGIGMTKPAGVVSNTRPDTQNPLGPDVARGTTDHSHNQTKLALPDTRTEKHLQAGSGYELGIGAVQANLAGALEASSRQSERTNTKPVSTRSNTNLEGAWGPLPLYSGSPLDVMPTTAADALVPPEMMVAEQVNYWISQDVQNAELKLDGFDGLPVEVRITLQGNEARVDFRTDQDGIREVLQNTESHLKDILAKEGLVLSGVSVGTSTQDGRGAPGQKEPEAKRRAEISVTAPVSEGAVRRSVNIGGKSIDVFV